MSSHRITGLLQAWRHGDDEALAALTPLVHGELRLLARAFMRRERDAHSLPPTGLVHECYLRLLDARAVDWQDRRHFYRLAARLMRRILVDQARSRGYAKRGGGAAHVSLEADDVPAATAPGRDLLALDDALRALATVDERQSQIVEMRFFGGFSNDDIAQALGVSTKTVMRDWQQARSWLLDALTADRAPRVGR
ncbi:MAG: sigma-70 family RNA polymerase sigma factor [Vicinamibacteraceae bacterium]